MAKQRHHKVGDRVKVDGRPGRIRSIGYVRAGKLMANIDLDDGGLVQRPVASTTITKEASHEPA